MATIFPRGPSKTFQCAVYVPTESGRKKRITGSIATQDRKTAGIVAGKVQELADALSPKERRTQAQLTRFIGAIYDAASVICPLDPKSGPQVKFEEFAKRWLDRKVGSTSAVTIRIAKAAIDNFSGYIGDRKLAEITGEDVQAWADAMLKSNYASATINGRVAVIKAVFRHAQNIGTIRVNPAAVIEVGKGKGVVNRQELPDDVFEKIFTSLDASTATTLPNAWKTAMMLGRYAGLRLRDAVNAKSSDFDSGKGILCYTALKTKRPVCIPVFAPLLEHLKTRQEACRLFGEAYFCEGLANKKANVLSQAFERIIAAAGVDNPETVVASGRKFNQYSFHCLRHSFVSWLKRIGVPQHLRMIMADHSTKRSHEAYDHTQAAELADQIAPFFK